MESAGLLLVRPTSSQASGTDRKRKASGAQNVVNAPQKKQKTRQRRPSSRAQAKNAINTSVITGGDKAPGSASIAPSTTSLPLPAGQSPVSSNFRAALCDSVVFWKAHQGGLHKSNKIVTGMLLNGKTTPRDVIQGQVIITTVGGGLVAGADGKHIRTEDQHEDNKNYVYLKNAMEVGQPIGIVIGKQAQGKGRYANNLVNVKLDHHYNVLDWFFITDIWSERQPTQRDGTSFAHFAVRMQKINLDSDPWWVPQGAEKKDAYTVGQFHCHTTTCQSCNTPSKGVFKEGWCCLEKTCPEFFHFSDPNIDLDSLQYHENFLNERTTWSSDIRLKNLVPELPVMAPNKYGSEKEFKDGIVCPRCQWASRRISWEGWTCEKGCGFKLPMPPRDIPMGVVHNEAQDHMKHKTKFYHVHPKITHTKHNVNGYDVNSFYLPNAPGSINEGEFTGSVTIFRSAKATRERRGGLDELFQEFQEATRVGDVKLQRNPAFCKGSHKEELTSHFSCNMGADYKFGVVVETSNGFANAPTPVMKALSRLTWAGTTAVSLTASHVAKSGLSVDSASMPDKFIGFNEELMLGYFENSTISFHDDGESAVGPTVATLSVGSPATMHFRAKKKTGFGDAIPSSRVMFSFYLEHGDIVIMHGTNIHKHYEHSVVAGGIRRFALTCRHIRPEMITDLERREQSVINGTVPLYWQNHAYNGESAATLQTPSLGVGANQSSADCSAD